MRYRMPMSKKIKTRKVIDIFGCMLPFSALSEMERDVLSIYINGYLELKDTHGKYEIFEKLFEYDFTKRVSDELSTKDRIVTMTNIRKYMTKLRKYGIFHKRTIAEKYLTLFDNLDKEITFVLEIKD